MHSTAGRYAAAIPLRVLVPAVQDGEFKTHNKLIAQGAAVAAAEINGHAGSAPRLRIELVRVPFRADADPRTLVRRAARSHVRIVLLPCNVDTEQAWAAAAASAGDLALSPCTPEPRALARFRMAWPTAMTGNAQAGQLAWYITSHQPKGTTAFLVSTTGSGYSATLARYLRRAARLNGVRIAGTAQVRPGHLDVRAVARSLDRSNAHAILMAAPPSTGWALIRGLRRRGVIWPVYATDALDARPDLRDPDRLVKNVMFTSYGFARPDARAFQQRYRKLYRRLPAGSFPGLGYEAMRVLGAAAERAGSVDPRTIDAVLRRGLTVHGIALGDVVFPGHGRRTVVTDVGMATVVRGQYKPLFAGIPFRAPAP